MHIVHPHGRYPCRNRCRMRPRGPCSAPFQEPFQNRLPGAHGPEKGLFLLLKPAATVYVECRAGVAELADAADLKSAGASAPYGFDPRPRHTGSRGASTAPPRNAYCKSRYAQGITGTGRSNNMADRSVSIIIPAYNEEAGLATFLERLISLSGTRGWEVIVIDDGSSDGTAEAARRAGARVLRHPYNKGYGAALKTGIRNAGGDVIVMMDSDGQHDPADIERLVTLIGEYDMVVGARGGSKGVRAPGKKVLSMVADYLSETKIPDLNSGFRAFRRETILEFLHICPNGFSFTTTITLAYLRSAYSVMYVPIEAEMRVGRPSNVKFFKDGYKTFLLIIRVIVLFNPMKVFMPASLLLLGVGIAFTLYGILQFGRAPNLGVLTILSSIILFFMGVLADQISALRRERRLD